MENKEFRFDAIKIQQPIGDFYIAVVDYQPLVEISYADVRRKSGRAIEEYIGTQRDLSLGRVAEIKQYVNLVDACFPTGIILSISSSDAYFDEKKKQLVVKNGKDVAKIIDGQHRIAGLEEGVPGVPFQLNVTVFIDMDLEDQAMVFATINLKQTKMNKSLAYDLLDYSTTRSPQKTAHQIAKLLNSKSKSPLEKRIKILGKATGGEFEFITQATFVDRLIPLITDDEVRDRDLIKRKKENKIPKLVNEKYVFQEKFLNELDHEIAKIIWNFFEAVASKWPQAWNNSESGQILCRTTGFAALMRVLPKLFLKTGNKLPDSKEFLKLLQKSTLKDADFTTEKYKPGSTGEGLLVKELTEQLGL